MGYVPSTVSSRSAGSLVLGYYDSGKLVYAGRVGTGWSGEQSRALRDEIENINGTKPQFAKALPAGAEKGVRWAKSSLVCEIEYRGWTQDRQLRAAAFKGLRDDKAAKDITLEASSMRSQSTPSRDPSDIHLTHPEKLLWVEAGITKQGTRRILCRYRRLDIAPHRRPAIKFGELSFGHGSQVLFRQAPLARAGQMCSSSQDRRERADACGR